MRFVRLGLTVLIALLVAGCIAPEDRRPGLRLPGQVAPIPSDWSVAKAHPLIALEVRTPYWLPHSITIARGLHDGELTVGSRDPETKRWPAWVDADPEVRLGIGDLVYEAKLVPITDPARIARIRAGAAANAGSADALQDFEIRFWRVQPRD